MPKFTNLKNSPVFTIKSYKGFSFKKWDAQNNKMLSSETYQEGYRKMYSFEVNDGETMELSKDQTGQCLVAALEAGVPAKGSTFVAKDNGKQGLDKRWWINLKVEEKSKEEIWGEDPRDEVPNFV